VGEVCSIVQPSCLEKDERAPSSPKLGRRIATKSIIFKIYTHIRTNSNNENSTTDTTPNLSWLDWTREWERAAGKTKRIPT